MTVFDIILCALLCYALYRGLRNGLFVELASFISLFLGIYVAIKFSYMFRGLLQNYVSWSAKYIEIIAFGLTFLLVVIGIHFLAKIFTGIADFAFLGWLNKLGGAAFSVLKTILLLSIVFNLFQKININHIFVSQKTLENSVFYNPIQEVSKFIYPSLENWFNDLSGQGESRGSKF